MFETEEWALLFLGIFGGFLISFVFWYWINHRLVPEIAFSNELSKRPIDYDIQGYRHQFAFKNVGKRTIINIRLKARLRVTDPLNNGRKLHNFFDIALTNNDIFELQPGRMLRFAFLVHKSTPLNSKILDQRIQVLMADEKATLDDIFEIYPSACCYVQLIGTDIYSNATKVFQSKMYGKQDIRMGIFRGKELDVVAA